MKKITLISTIMLFVLIGCGATDQVQIGVMAPLTGPAAELGQHIQRGVEIANMQFGYELIFEDTKCVDTKSALSAAQKLITIDKVKHVIGPLCAPAFQAVSGLFNAEEVAFMHTSGVTPPFIASSGSFGIPGITTTIYQEDAVLVEFVFNEMDIKTMGLLIWNEEWAVEHSTGFTKRFTALGGKIVLEEMFDLQDSDFRTSVLKLHESGAEGVFVVGLNFQTAEIVKQIRELDAEIQIFSQFEIEDPAFLEPAGEAAEGMVYVYPKIDITSSEVQAFIQKYKELYGTEPNYYAFVGYDSLKLFDWAIAQCEDVSCVTSTILSTQNFSGVSGLMSFKNKAISREFEIKTIRNGEFVPY